MIVGERRTGILADRRFVPRGGRRAYDLPGQYPPVLVADGYEAARRPCATYLHHLRFEVAEAAVPTEAVALLASGWLPHVILADALSVEAVSRHLASFPRFLTPQLIVMTGFPEEVRRGKSSLLVKPFRLKAMIQTVRRVLRRQAQGRSQAHTPLSGS